MQEDIEMKSITLAINSSKFTGRVLKSAISKFLARKHNKAAVVPHGKQSVKKLIQQEQGVSNIEINDPSIREFERIARKYGVSFAVKKVKGEKPKYLVFFKSRDADAITAAFTEYSNKRMKNKACPSVLAVLKAMKALVAKRDPLHRKDQELSR